MSRVLVVGSGGRESTIVWKLLQSPRVKHIWVAPGNGGTARLTASVENVKASSVTEIISFAERERPDLVVVGPEAPLAEGIADELAKRGVRCFGPCAAAARIEASKAFAKDFMARHKIPTAEYRTFKDAPSAMAYIDATWERMPVVVKASGLAAGKGVVVPQTKEEAKQAVHSMMVDKIFGDAASEVVLEELMEGEEVSCMAFSDGEHIVSMPSAQDHKRVGDGDAGPNTGGMGAFAPSPLVSQQLREEIVRTILAPAIAGMKAEGHAFVGVLFAGIMLTRSGPKTLEYNCRFGDPETEVVLPLLQSDLYDVLEKCVEGRLAAASVQWSEGACAGVVCASKGYPGKVELGLPIRGLESIQPPCVCFHAGSKVVPEKNEIVTSGGRVLVIAAYAPTLSAAVSLAYSGVERVHFDGMHYRRDVGRRIVRLGVMGSTRGTDMQYLIDAIAAGTLSAQIKLVISNKKDAYILERARLHGIPERHIESQGKSREDFEGEVIQAFEEVGGVDLVLLIGFMRIVSPRLINAYPNRILNVHPSLLPDFAGGMDLKVHEAVLVAKRTESGCTVHIVDVKVDAGAIVIQKRCTIDNGETPETLKAKVQALEGPAFAEAIALYAKNRKFRLWYRE